MTRLLRPPTHEFPRVFSREEGNAVEEALLGIVTTINNYLSNYILIILLLGMGIWFTVRTKAIQFRCFGEGWRRVFGNFSLRGGNQGGGMTSFQALSTAIAAQVGTGNIVGACGAIIVGGPGAIFWMWIIALLGMATNYAEAVMACLLYTSHDVVGNIRERARAVQHARVPHDGFGVMGVGSRLSDGMGDAVAVAALHAPYVHVCIGATCELLEHPLIVRVAAACQNNGSAFDENLSVGTLGVNARNASVLYAQPGEGG